MYPDWSNGYNQGKVTSIGNTGCFRLLFLRVNQQMPTTEIPLDSSVREEDVTVLHGRNLLLKIIEDQEARHFLASEDVRQFLETEDLCLKDLGHVMNRMLELEDQNDRRLAEGGSSYVLDVPFRMHYRRFKSRRAMLRDWKALVPISIWKHAELPAEHIAVLKKRNEASMRELRKVDRELVRLEKEVKRFNRDLDVLYPSVLLRCSRCGSPVYKRGRPTRRTSLLGLQPVKGEIKGLIRCLVCGYEISREKAHRTYLHIVKEPIRRLWGSNLWLEDHISRLLTSMQWRTWFHVNVLGSSGVRHEIDVLAVKQSFVLVCECKSGSVSRQDVFNFWAKVYDIRSHMSMLALIEHLPEPETREFLRKNPSVLLLENLGEKRRNQILQELSQSILGKI